METHTRTHVCIHVHMRVGGLALPLKSALAVSPRAHHRRPLPCFPGQQLFPWCDFFSSSKLPLKFILIISHLHKTFSLLKKKNKTQHNCVDKLCRVTPSHLEVTWVWLRSSGRHLFLMSTDPATELCGAELNKDVSSNGPSSRNQTSSRAQMTTAGSPCHINRQPPPVRLVRMN